ncbi:MAG: phosphoribosylformylglycinamidine synthase subunit PurL [Candidatus Omnitrophica bacterium]|nr:phosphoribosylformylglycinamidine synthase subunit PurL [Candidatus Omnitrophota bacterium]MCF7894153.1 phosphoribosylformylglycinamidine synthase subunit PurL [Candidatus Omnitrophota bacterium]
MIWRIDVFSKKKEENEDLKSQIKDLGFQDFSLTTKKVYLIEAELKLAKIEQVAEKLLIDPITEQYSVSQGIFTQEPSPQEVMVVYHPGVFDSVAASLKKAIGDLSLDVTQVHTATVYHFEGLNQAQIQSLGPKVIYNPVIEQVADYKKLKDLKSLSQLVAGSYRFELKLIDILGADKERLKKISKDGCLALNILEMEKIQEYFKKLKRNPTDCELETLAVLWSEHCGHKTFSGLIDYKEEKDGKTIKKERINNLLKSTIMKATKEIDSSECVSVFDDNSGIVKFDQGQNICFKVETHNHPSSLEPYGGASTGIGGVIRDVLGTGCGFKPFASIDAFCFSNWQIEDKKLPKGLLHPRRIIKGVVSGVRDYGNRMGIPTVAGSVLFDDRFLGNPLVYCGTLGIGSADKSFKKVKKGDLIVVCGARTGKDGIHGATFSSQELDQEAMGLRGAVQIGNPIEEKKVTDALMQAQAKDLFTAITDCGAGGLSSAVTELAKGYGAKVDLDKVPLKYKGLSYTDIWISESQERMVFFTQEDKLKELEDIFAQEEVDMTVIGEVTDSNELVLFYQNNKVAELDMDFIFSSLQVSKKAIWIDKKQKKEQLKEKDNYNSDLTAILSSANIAPKDWILDQYDHEVQGGSVLKTINNSPIRVNDAAVVRPKLSSEKAVVVGCGINPFYSDIDPYWMAASAIDEALRNVVSTGASLDKTFILDNFSWGSPEDPQVLGSLVRAAKACYDYSVYFGVPFISGKDSLYNEYNLGNNKITIPGTLLISAMSVLDNWQLALTSSFLDQDSLIYLVGLTKPELGQSEYLRQKGIKQGLVPKVEPKAKDIFVSLSNAIGKKLVSSCHDLSEGGLAVAASEMCVGSGLGASLFLEEVPAQENTQDQHLLFAESPSRFLVEVAKEKKQEFEKQFQGLPIGLIGCSCSDKQLTIYNKKSVKVVDISLSSLEESLRKTFKEFRWKPKETKAK